MVINYYEHRDRLAEVYKHLIVTDFLQVVIKDIALDVDRDVPEPVAEAIVGVDPDPDRYVVDYIHVKVIIERITHQGLVSDLAA